jgi:hypothetical protein
MSGLGGLTITLVFILAPPYDSAINEQRSASFRNPTGRNHRRAPRSARSRTPGSVRFRSRRSSLCRTCRSSRWNYESQGACGFAARAPSHPRCRMRARPNADRVRSDRAADWTSVALAPQLAMCDCSARRRATGAGRAMLSRPDYGRGRGYRTVRRKRWSRRGSSSRPGPIRWRGDTRARCEALVRFSHAAERASASPFLTNHEISSAFFRIPAGLQTNALALCGDCGHTSAVGSCSRATLMAAPVRAAKRRRSAEERVRLVVNLSGAALAEARAPGASRSTAKGHTALNLRSRNQPELP